jgi:hypothetical protein
MDGSPRYCDHCGLPLDRPGGGVTGGGRVGSGAAGQSRGAEHEACVAARALEPPRYCPRCGRRMVVKVTPHGWTSQCSRHGLTTGTEHLS